MLNLFQKYRPLTFKDVVGHEIQLKELQKRARDKNFPQCIYITGYTGTGKTVLSRIIAKSLICKNLDKDGNPCNECKECIAINTEQELLNYFEENGSNCNIDRMREIEEISKKRIMFSDSSVKVFYIDELQEIASKSKEALKNLLKLLEKPNKNNYFILGSMEDSGIPEAVRNRCVTYKLKLLTKEDISNRLAYICEKEGVVLDTEEKANVVFTIAENSRGSLRTAISYLERCIYGNIWKEEEVIKELEIFSDAQTNNIITNLLVGKAQKDVEFNEKIIDTITYKLVNLYKAMGDNNLTPYQKSLISGIGLPSRDKRQNIEIIENSLHLLYELHKYSYVTKALTEYTILFIQNSNRNILDRYKNSEVRIPRVPRQV